jgi:DNA repair protein RadD
MTNPFSRLPFADLHSEIPDEIGEEVDYFYRTKINQDGEFTEKNVWNDKETLGALVQAISMDKLFSQHFRKNLLQHQNPADLEKLARKIGIDPDGTDHVSLSQTLSKIPWERNNNEARILAEYFGYSPSVLPSGSAKRTEEKVLQPPSQPHKSLMLYQLEVANNTENSLSRPNSRTLMQMPTGSGKTRVAMEVITRFLNQRDGGTDVLWLAHVRELCYQAAEALEEVWAHIGEDSLKLSVVEGRRSLPDFSEMDKSVTVATLQKMRAILRSEDQLPEFDLVIIDEAHKAVAPTYQEVILESMGLGSRLLGLTATPGRSFQDSAQNQKMADFFYENKITIRANSDEPVIYDLQKNGVLARLQRQTINTCPDIDISSEDIDKMLEEGDVSADILAELALDRHRNEKILDKLIEVGSQELQTIFFATSVEQSKLFASILTAKGYEVAHVDGKTRKDARDFAVQGFVKGKIQFLFNYNVFSAGFDAPSTDCVFIARPTLSIVRYSQMIGRGLRGPKLGGNSVCQLVDVVDNVANFSRDMDEIYRYFEDYWSDPHR